MVCFQPLSLHVRADSGIGIKKYIFPWKVQVLRKIVDIAQLIDREVPGARETRQILRLRTKKEGKFFIKDLLILLHVIYVKGKDNKI